MLDRKDKESLLKRFREYRNSGYGMLTPRGVEYLAELVEADLAIPDPNKPQPVVQDNDIYDPEIDKG